MANRLSSKLFEAREIHNILGIARNKLFYWTKTHQLLKPDQIAVGTGNRTKFSLKNLLELAFIKELLAFGYDLNSIYKIKKSLDSIGKPKGSLYDNILNDEFMEEIVLIMFKHNNKIHFKRREVGIVGEPDGEHGYVKSYELQERDLSDIESSSIYTTLEIKIGVIAANLLKRAKKA